MDFSKFDSMVDTEGLKNDIKEAEENGTGNFKEVPHGTYEVSIEKLELTETRQTEKPMVTCWMRIVSDGEYKGQMLFMNQVVMQGFQIHIMNEFLRSLVPDGKIRVEFESFTQYNELLMDIAEYVNDRYEYAVSYEQTNKGYDKYTVVDVFELEG